MENKKSLYNLLKEEVEQHFAGVKSMKEFNERRQTLADDWSGKYEKPVEIKLRDTITTVPEWVVFMVLHVDASGLSVKLLGVGHQDPKEKE